MHSTEILVAVMMAVGGPLIAATGPWDSVAVDTLRKQAKGGNAAAQLALGYGFAFGLGVRIDFVQARYWASEAAGSQISKGLVLHAMLMNQGWGGAREEARAHRTGAVAQRGLVAEAETGDVMSQALLGWLMSEGLGVDRDEVLAFSWAAKSAKSGHPLGQNLLGTLYAGGRGVDKDIGEALIWFRAAADQNLAQAQFNIGKIHAYSPRHKDPEEAVKWWTRAAEQNHPGAQCALGVAFEDGVGAKQDLAEAYAWYVMARKEDPDAARRCGLVAPKLADADKVRAEERIVALRKRILEQQ